MFWNNHVKTLVLSIALATIILFAGCAKSPYPENVQKTLKKAKKNKTELIRVIEHYKNDPEKLKAAYFVIGNMDGHCYAPFELLNKKKKNVHFNVLDYPDYKTLKKALKELEKKEGELDFHVRKKNIVYDAKVIKADFLIEQFDYAFKAWKELPWSQGYSFDIFKNYILPYRGSNEPLDKWRKPLLEKYKNWESKMKNPKNPIEIATLINDDIKSWFKFDPRFYVHPTDQGYSEMCKSKLGRCEDMTNITIFAFRANGIAITSDYTPHWANTGNNHAWNAIVYPDGKAVPFMGAETGPGKYKLSNKLAKVYRKMFAVQKSVLYFQKRKQKKIAPWLAGKNYIDVTRDYVDVCDITTKILSYPIKKTDIAYLCVFNSGEWRAMQWGRIINDEVIFKDMGKNNILYMPALYKPKKGMLPCGLPFILHNDRGKTDIKTDANKKIKVELVSTTHRKQLSSTDGIKKTFLKKNTEYELFYWDNEWRSLGKKKAQKDVPLTFENVQSNGLYWLVQTDGDKEERPFTIDDNGNQIFW
ncbi:transglutaminase domain-containing protein [bacterium]|nr:transglutaminase domain-containing protein [bacterium]